MDIEFSSMEFGLWQRYYTHSRWIDVNRDVSFLQTSNTIVRNQYRTPTHIICIENGIYQLLNPGDRPKTHSTPGFTPQHILHLQSQDCTVSYMSTKEISIDAFHRRNCYALLYNCEHSILTLSLRQTAGSTP